MYITPISASLSARSTDEAFEQKTAYVPEAEATASFGQVFNNQLAPAAPTMMATAIHSTRRSLSAIPLLSATNTPLGAQVSGNKGLDGNKETQNFGNEDIWRSGGSNLPVRCLANDDKTNGMGKDYFCDDVVSATGGLEMRKNADGTITAIGRDFISPDSGLYYKFMGFTIAKSGSPLVTDNMTTLSPGQQKGVFRAYWNTYTLADVGASSVADQAKAITTAQINQLHQNTLMQLSSTTSEKKNV